MWDLTHVTWNKTKQGDVWRGLPQTSHMHGVSRLREGTWGWWWVSVVAWVQGREFNKNCSPTIKNSCWLSSQIKSSSYKP